MSGLNGKGMDGLGGNNPQQLEEMMKMFNNLRMDGPAKTPNAPRGQNDKETSAKSEGEGKNNFSVGKDIPSLFPPIQGLAGRFSGGGGSPNGHRTTSGLMAAYKAAAVMDPSDPEQAGKLVSTYGEAYKGIGILREYEVDDVAILALINEFLEDQGINTPVPPNHPKLEQAVEHALQVTFTEIGYTDANAKASFITQTSVFQNNLVEYSGHLQSIDPTGKTLFDDPNAAALNLTIIDGMAEQVGVVIDVLSRSTVEQDAGVLNYLKAIADLVAELKVTFLEMEMTDISRAGEVARAKEKITGDLLNQASDKIYKIMAQQKFMGDIKKATYIFKVLNPVLSGGCLILSIVCMIFLGPIGLLVAAVAVIMFVLITTLSTIEVDKDGEKVSMLQYIFDGISSWVEKGGQKAFATVGVEGKLAKRLSKILFWAGVIVILIVAMAVAMFIPSLGPVLIAVLMPMLMAVLQSSGIMKEIVGWIMEKEGYDEEDKLRLILEGVAAAAFSVIVSMGVQLVMKILEMLVEAVQTIIKMIIALIPTIIYIIGKIVIWIVEYILGGIPAIADATLTMVIKVLNILLIVMVVLIQVLTTLIEVIKNLIQGNVFEVLKQLLALVMIIIQAVIQVVQVIQQGVETVVKTLKDTVQGLIIDTIVNLLKTVINVIKSAVNSLKQLLMEVYKLIVDLFVVVAKSIAQIATVLQNLAVGAANMQLAQLVVQTGKIEAFMEFMKEIAKILDDVLKKILGRSADGLDNFDAQVEELSRIFEKIVNDLRGVGDELFSSAMV